MDLGVQVSGCTRCECSGLMWRLHGGCSKFDLYSKSDDVPDPEKLKPYYQALIDKYCPGLIAF